MEILLDRSLLKLKGKDSGKLLQSLTTNNVLSKNYSYNYLLNNQGRYLFDFFIIKRSDDEFWLDTSKDSKSSLAARLNMYKLRSDVVISDISDDFFMCYSRGQEFSSGFISYPDPRFAHLGFREVLPKNEIDLNDDSLEKNIYLEDKYNFAIPDGVSDLIYEKSLVVEYGAEELNAISYDKGCYVGQEVVSRVKYQGVVRKKIFKLLAKTEIDYQHNPGDDVLDLLGNKIGIVCSHYHNTVISLLREESYLDLSSKQAIINNNIFDIFIPPWY